MAKKATSAKKTAKKSVATTKTEKNEYTPDLSFLPLWAKKMNVAVEDLEKELHSIAKELYARHSDKWSWEKCYATARRKLYGTHKAEVKSNAIPFDFTPHYGREPYDYGNVKYREQLDAYAKNPMQAKKEGRVRVEKNGKDTNIIPMDITKTTKSGKQNPNFNKPLAEHAYIMGISGLGSPSQYIDKEDWDKIRPTVITISGRYADPTSPQYIGKGFERGKWYRIKVSNRTNSTDEEKWEVNATSLTKWNEMLDIEMDIEDIKAYYSDMLIELGELEEYHDSYAELGKDGNKSFSKQIVLTEGEVIDIILSEDGIKSHRIVIDDESLGFGAEDGEIPDSITCWVDASEKINFGKYSRVMLWGTTSKSKRKDMATNEYTEQWNSPSIGVQGIVVIDLVEPDVNDEEGGDETGEYEYDDTDDGVKIEEPDVESDESVDESIDETTDNTKNDKW